MYQSRQGEGMGMCHGWGMEVIGWVGGWVMKGLTPEGVSYRIQSGE